MKRINWELMRPQDIEIRPATVKDGKATLLLYQDARNTMDALDRNFGEFGWQMTYKDVGGQIYGCLSIFDIERGVWITKEDTGDESNISAQKGQSSDILKRCAVRFGYGRELYSAPRIIVEDDKYGNTGYKVTDIQYNDSREIIALSIANRFGKNVFNWKLTDPVTQPQQQQQVETDEQRRLRQLAEWFKGKQKEEGIDKDQLIEFKDEYKRRAKDFKYRNYDCEKLWAGWLVRKQSA